MNAPLHSAAGNSHAHESARAQVQGAAPFATPTLEVQVGGVGPFLPIGSLAAMGAAAITTPQTKSWNFAYVNGDMALFNNTAAGTIVPGCTGRANVLATCSSPAVGYWWRRLAISAVGNHTVRLTVFNTAAQSDVRLLSWNVRAPSARTARNVILFIGDGNNIPFITASRLASRGQTGGKLNEKLHQQMLDRVGMVSTNGYDSIITDSANSAAAYACGHKGAVNGMGVYRDGDFYSTDAAFASARDDFNDPKVELITERIRREIPGMAIGVVTTSEIQDATPAAFFAHSASRYNKKEITEALWTASYGYGPVKPDVVFGGGGYYFNASYTAAGVGRGCLTTSQTGGFPAPGASRFDCFAAPRSLWAEAAAPALGNYSSVVLDRSQMKAQELKGNRMLGIWHSRNQETHLDRHIYTSNLKAANWPVTYNATEEAAFQKPTTDQPDLLEATQTAINVLSRRGGSSGFFLMVEGAGIDKAEQISEEADDTGETDDR
jgi:alkaline phosphatase